MSRLPALLCVLLGGGGLLPPDCLGQATAPTGSPQAAAVRTPSQTEVRLLQALRANPTTAPYPFATEPRGSKVVLHGRVGAKIVHDVAVRMAIDLNVPIDDDITIDTAFRPASYGGFGTVPGPGPTSSGGVGFGGPPAFGNYGTGYGGGAYGVGGPGGGLGPYAGYGGGSGASVPPVLGFPSAGSYGGAPSLLPPPIFGRYDDPFYGFDPPAVVYPPWWGALNAQRVQANAGFNAPVRSGVSGVAANGGTIAPGGVGQGAYPTRTATGGLEGGAANAAASPGGGTETDIGVIPDGTIDMAIDGAGVATIRGGVPTQAERLAIAQRVAQITGVSQVVNLLTIKPALGKINELNTPPPPVPADAAPNGGGGPPPAPIVSTPINPNNPRSNPQATDAPTDANLTERASKGLADRAATIGAPVRVKVRDGVAQLSGKLASVYEAMLAYRSVQQTPGIRGVDDRLEFPVPDGSNASNPLIEKGRPDDVEPYLEAQIRRQVGDLAHVDRVRIQADTLDLRGTLGRAEDRDRFDAILRSMPILRGFQVHTDMPIASP